MATTPSPQTFGRRYLLHECLGIGGMGAVYRATDRLTGQLVALKRVVLPLDQLAIAERSGTKDPSLALAQEFKTLASLHHPHVIPVLDYGFDQAGQPFYTMDLLEGAQTIANAGLGCDLETKVDLMVQALRALAYLHRRNVLHRDLKPGNILVVGRKVQVLDFGVSVTTSRTMEYLTLTTAGTIAYLAPELFEGAPVTRASDLYALGVIAYQLFVGRFPYDDANMAVLMREILTKPVDVRSTGVGDALAVVLERLLAKKREDRYDDAEVVISDLCAATECPPPTETWEIRESYLQAARFVGRKRELAQLSEALGDALNGSGSAWLVGGESGVGKSRLVDELRTLALVKGATVLHGQAVSKGRSPYQLWRSVLRRLVLTSDLTEEEATGLKFVVHDITDLMGFDVPEPPSLDPQATQARLLSIVSEVIGRQDRPMVVILADLQWAGSESLAMLDQLTRDVAGLALLVIGEYRDDERPNLPRDLPGMQVLRLQRLTEQEVAELSVSMLGPAGRREQVVALLQRETEGNPFFLVEVARALAEEVGQLDQIGETALPVHVFAGGVQDIVQRRLNRVPEGARPLLQLAAVAGRDLDLGLLRTLAPKADLQQWLTICADVAVLEAEGGQWRFAHHQLHQATLAALPDDVRPGYHRRVAEALERSSPERIAERVGLLAHLWEQAREPGKAIEYLLLAGDQARLAYAHEDAADRYQRALAFLRRGRDYKRTARTLMKLGLTYHAAFDFQRAREAYSEGFVLRQRSGQAERPSRAPRRTLRLSHAEPTGLDPALACDMQSMPVLDQLFSGLVELTPELDIVPDIARAWEILDGGRRYVFHLRDDSRWSDGAPVVAEDFVFAWQRVLDPEVGSPAASLLYDIKGAHAFHLGEVSDYESVAVRAPNPTTIVVELEEPAAYFLQELASSPAHPVPRHVLQRHDAAWTDEANLVTNGPFRLDRWEKGKLLVLSQNPDWHGSPTGNVSRVELSLSGEPSAQLQRYGADELHILDMQFFGPVELDAARTLYAGEYVTIPQLFTSYVGFAANQSPFHDPRVRRAFVLATDREALAEVVLRGFVSPAHGGFVPPGMPGHSPQIGLTYDPGQARRFLREAGYPGGQGFPLVEFMVHTDPASAVAAPILQRQWQENLGLTIRWKAVEWAEYLDRINRRPPHLFLWGWAADYPDPHNFLSVCRFRDYTRWQNEAYNSLVEGAGRVLDQQERLSLYKQADRMLIGEAAILPLVYYRSHLLVKPTVVRIPLSPMAYWFWKDVIELPSL